MGTGQDGNPNKAVLHTCLHPPVLQLKMHPVMSPLWVLGNRTQIFMLAQQAIYPVIHLSSSSVVTVNQPMPVVQSDFIMTSPPMHTAYLDHIYPPITLAFPSSPSMSY